MNIILSDFRENLGKIIKWVIIVMALAFLLMLLFPILAEKNFNLVFEKILTSSSNIVNIFIPLPEKFLYDELYYFYNIILVFNFLALIFSLNISTSSLAKEQGLGRIDYLYLGEIDRTDLYFYKFFSNILIILSYIIISTILLFVLYTNLFDVTIGDLVSISIDKIVLIFITCILFSSLGIMISSGLNRIRSVGTINFLIIIISLGLYILYSLTESNIFVIKVLALNSLVYFIRTGDMIFFILVILIYLVISIIFTVIGLNIYNRKDLVI